MVRERGERSPEIDKIRFTIDTVDAAIQAQPVDFRAGVISIAERIVGKQIVLLDEEGNPTRRVQPVIVEAFPLAGTEWSSVLLRPELGLDPYEMSEAPFTGTGVWTRPPRGKPQFIISSGNGSCVRVVQSRKVERGNGELMKNESDTAVFLGLGKHELLDLRTTSNPRTLHLIRTGRFYDTSTRATRDGTPDDYFDSFTEEQ